MPVKPQRSNPDRTTILQIRIPGWLKNQILDAAGPQSLNTYVAGILHQAVNKPTEAPLAPSEPRSVSVTDVIADYLSGRSTVAPCGRVWPCDGSGTEPVVVNGNEFCAVCNIRLR